MTQKNKLFCFGYGYSCDRLGEGLIKTGQWNVTGTTRDEEKCAELTDRGVRGVVFDTAQPMEASNELLQGVTHLLISTPPDDDGDPVYRRSLKDLLNISTLEWVGYFSTTGVYGNRDGGWVDEDSEVRPTSKRGSRRAQAEEQWLSALKEYGLPVHIFRLAGIYGPGRSAIDSVRAGIARRIHKPDQAFSRVHVDDIVQVLQASMARPAPGSVYNVCDDMPAPSHEVIEVACELLGRPVPPLVPYEQASLAPITRSFYEDNKRVRNQKIKDDLGVDLKYSNFREGLKACMDAEGNAISFFKRPS